MAAVHISVHKVWVDPVPLGQISLFWFCLDQSCCKKPYRQKCLWPALLEYLMRGGGGGGGRWDFRFCGSVFALTSCGISVFSNLVFGFRFLQTMIAVSWIFLSNKFSGSRKLHAALALENCSSKGPLTVRGMHDKPSLFSSLFLSRNGC